MSLHARLLLYSGGMIEHLHLSKSWTELHWMFGRQDLWNNVEIPGTDSRLYQHIVENAIVNVGFQSGIQRKGSFPYT